jgi:hypothetical protein
MRAFASVLAFAIAVVVCATFASRLTRADVPTPPIGTPSADDMREARRHFAVGNDLYKDGRYKEALLEFDAAYGLSGRPAALLNVGDCQRQLNAYVDAYQTYQAVLARHGAQLSGADKAAVQKAVEYLEGHTGLLAVAANVDGAEVLVDDRVVGRTPLAAPLRLDVGSHKLLVRKDGFDPFTPPADLQLLSKQIVKVDAKLVPEVVTGHLSVREEKGRPVHILVDESDRGPAPWEGDLAPGPHTVEGKGDQLAAEKRSVALAKGQRFDLVITAEPTTGRLRIAASPAAATIEVDHRQVGAGSWEGDVPPGSHHIEVALGDVHAARDVVVDRGATVVQEVPLAVPVAAPPPYEGFYGRLAPLLFLLAPNTPIANAVPGVVDVQHGQAVGLGSTLHIGHSFGFLSAELASAVLFTNYHEVYQGSPEVLVQTWNGFVGPGARITTRNPTLRVTAGFALGAAIRSFHVSRSAQSPDGLDKSAGYVDPALLFDAGFLVGSTPGVKFFLGALAWVDFPSKDVVVGPDPSTSFPDAFYTAPGHGYRVASGPQGFFGPTLGVQFGH